MWRNRKVVGRRHAGKDATGEIELRAVARAEEAAGPVGAEIGGCDFEPGEGCAAQMRADAFKNEKGGLDAPMRVPGVFRLLGSDRKSVV